LVRIKKTRKETNLITMKLKNVKDIFLKFEPGARVMGLLPVEVSLQLGGVDHVEVVAHWLVSPGHRP
jgi:hypothetical protein